MLENSEVDCHRTIKLLSSKAYDVDQLLDVISEVVYPCNQHKEDISSRYGKWSDIAESNNVAINHVDELGNGEEVGIKQEAKENQCDLIVDIDSCLERRKEYKIYLVGQLLNAARKYNFELWNMYLSRKAITPTITQEKISISADLASPAKVGSNRKILKNKSCSIKENSVLELLKRNSFQPSGDFCNQKETYSSAMLWAKMYYILKKDLLSFCNSEKIHVVFDNEINKSFELDTNYDSVQKQKNDAEKENREEFFLEIDCLLKDTNSNSNVNSVADSVSEMIIKDPDNPPGITSGMVAITELAIRAAWQLECQTGRKASAKDVIKMLQSWVGSRDHTELREILPHGVKWMTISNVEKDYNNEACRKTLTAWHANRFS